MSILLKENILTQSQITTKNQAIHLLVTQLQKNDYVTEGFEQAVLAKEKIMNTAIGFGVAIPHALETMKSTIIRTGLAILTTPDGINWGDEIVKLIILIAAKDDEHMSLLSQIALACSSEEAVNKIVDMTQEEIIQQFKI